MTHPSAYSAAAARIEALWRAARPKVLTLAVQSPCADCEKAAYLSTLDELYVDDAYNSLSIEGYVVTTELIERVRSDKWTFRADEADYEDRDVLAARGYWQAFLSVRRSVELILDGADPGVIARSAVRTWYAELFKPFVDAGIMSPSALVGYRNIPVYLRGSRHVPPRWEAIPDALDTMFDLLQQETSPIVRAVLGHWLMGYIHPFPDGNGRTARFLMNAMLASGGLPWLTIRFEHRAQYLETLEQASVGGDVLPFARFIVEGTTSKIG